MSRAVKPGYATNAIWVITVLLVGRTSQSSERFAVLVGWDADAPDEVAPHGFGSSEAASRSDSHHGVVSLFQLPARGFGAHAFDILAGRLADLVGKHPSEMPRAHCGAAGQIVDAVRTTGFALDGFLHLANRWPLGPGHPYRSGELR